MCKPLSPVFSRAGEDGLHFTFRSGGASPRGRWTRSSRPMTLPVRQSSPSAPPAAATSARAARSLRHSPAPVTGRRASASHPPSRSRKLPTGSSPSANNLSGAKLHSPAIGFFRWPGIFSNLYLIYARFFAISLNLRLEYAIFFLSGSAGFRDSSYRHCTAADHAAGKPVESERMTRYAARNTRRSVPAHWRVRLELGYGAQSHQPPIRHQLHDQRTAAVLYAPPAAKT